jgi:hypothetical protein
MKLDTASFANARRFLLEEARPLESALFRYHFEGASAGPVVDALSAYQHPDGGFGRALEPDFRLPDSSPMATSVAFQVMREVGLASDHPLVRSGVTYLLDTYDPVRKGWAPVRPEVNDHPHAPWWSYTGEAAWGNPDVELAGVLNEYAELAPEVLRVELDEEVVSRLCASQGALDPYLALCALRYVESARDALASRILARVRDGAREIVPLDPSRWEEEHFQPFWLAPHPRSPLADLLRPQLDANLEMQINSQQEDGSWEPRWSWGALYPEAWRQARREWRGVQTLLTLRALAAHGMT